jgi:hypothetical protein
MKRIFLAFFLPCVLLGLPVVAQQTSIAPQTQGEVAYVSGGVGGEEREAMKAMRADYNLSLLFTVKGSGEYISDAKVCIKDARGAVRLETVADGPMLYAKLKPGRYSISADRDGHIMESKVTLSDRKLTALAFACPAEAGD